MSNCFKKVRIVHSPVEQVYSVQIKPIWRLRWSSVDGYPYKEIPDMHPFGINDKQEQAFEKAKAKAETLLAKTVVWERANYYWMY
jgi:hypothetical protein